MSAKCKQQHSLSAGALLLASKPSIKDDNFSYGSSDKQKKEEEISVGLLITDPPPTSSTSLYFLYIEKYDM